MAFSGTGIRVNVSLLGLAGCEKRRDFEETASNGFDTGIVIALDQGVTDVPYDRNELVSSIPGLWASPTLKA
jgi:hypothetical protein